MNFRVVVPSPGSQDYMGIAPTVTTPSNIPYNSSPYLLFIRQVNPDDYVVFSLSNGFNFGLTSVQLADPASPSCSLLPIAFVGFKTDGSVVTNVFTTPGSGADHLATYQFGADFASRLVSVRIDAPRWAMDNLAFGNVFVPEPNSLTLLWLGLLGLRLWRRSPH